MLGFYVGANCLAVKSERANASERLYYRPREAADLTGLGRRTIYANVYARHHSVEEDW